MVAGHSLGGAVAALSTLRLLRQLPSQPVPRIKCICFGSPAVGNAALAQMVANSGWEPLFHSVVLPGMSSPATGCRSAVAMGDFICNLQYYWPCMQVRGHAGTGLHGIDCGTVTCPTV